EFASLYFERPARQGLPMALLRLQERVLAHHVTLFTPWSTWAADSLRKQGIDEQRIRVLPPGVDLEQWKPRPFPATPPGSPMRLLFVGGDFGRKGGEMLLDMFHERLMGRCELD